MRLSEIATTAAAEYQIPVKNVATDTLSFRGSVGTREIGDLDTDQISLGASLNDAWRGFERRLYLVAERESWTENDQPLTENVFYPGMQLTSRQAADAESLFTRKGYSWSTDIRGGSESLESSTSFLRLHVTGNVVVPLAERVRFLFRSEYGAIDVDELSQLAAVPALLRGRRSERPRLSIRKARSDGHDGRSRRRPLSRHGKRRARLPVLSQLRRGGVLRRRQRGERAVA